MKRNKLTPAFALSALLLSACASTSSETTQPQTQIDTTHEAESLKESIESKVDVETAPTAAATNSLEDLADYLKENNMIKGEPAGVPAEALGTISGAKYDVVAIYEYDKDSESYKSLLNNGYVTLEGLGTKIEPSAVNDKYMLLCDQAENRDEIIKVFMNFE